MDVRWVPAMALVAALLAGCSDEPAPQGPPAAICPHGMTHDGVCLPLPLPAPDPIAIHDRGSMLEGMDRSWAWTVTEHLLHSFTVAVGAFGYDGAPVYHVEGYEITLVDDGETAGDGGCAGCGVTGTSSTRLFTWSAPEESDGYPVAKASGDWELRLRSGPSAAEFDVDVSVVYWSPPPDA